MRVIGILLVIVALVIAVVPAFTNCSAEGFAIELPGGKTVPMKCYWTAQASLAVGVTLGVVGLLLVFAKRKESQVFLSVIALVLSAFAALLPAALIGVCAMNKLCSNVEKPALILAGIVGAALSVAGLVIAARRSDDGEASTPSAGATS